MIKLRHILSILLIVFLSVNFSGSGDEDSDLDCACEDDYSYTSDDDTSSDDDLGCGDCYDDTDSTTHDGSSDCIACTGDDSDPAGTASTGSTGTTGSTGSTPLQPDTKPVIVMNNQTQYVTQGAPVTLSASITDEDGDYVKLKWLQLSGLPEVTLTGRSQSNCTFTAPNLKTVLTFQLMADDGDNEVRSICTVYVGY